MKPEERDLWLSLVVLGAIPWLIFAAAWRGGYRPFGPQRRRATPWDSSDMALLLASLAPQFALALYKLVSGPEEFEPPQWLVVASAACSLLQFSMPIYLIMLRGARPYQMGIECSHLGQNVLLGIGSFFLAMPLVSVAFIVAAYFSETRRHTVEDLLRQSPTIENFVLWGVMVIVVAPVLEELLFRGILLPGLRRRLKPWPAMLVGSAIFSLLHVDAWPAPVPLFVLAIFLSYLWYRTNSLVPSIVLHAVFNGANLLPLIWMLKNGTPGDGPD